MKHYSEASWVDLGRNLVTPDAKMNMQQHIDDGCQKCAVYVKTWQAVYSVAKAEAAFTPPPDVVRVVKSQFPMAAPKASGLRLLFDSNREPVPAGIRGSVAARQFLYETDEYYIDLRIEPHREADHAALVGQVLNRTGKERAAQGLAVLLHAGSKKIAQTSTNQFGEFQFEFDAVNSLSISVSRDKSDEIVLPLYGIQTKPTGRSLD